MDKFNELIKMLEEIISRIDEEIEVIEKDYKQLEERLKATENDMLRADNNLHKYNAILETLEHYDKKNIIIIIIKDILKEIKDYFQGSNIKIKIFLMLILILLPVLLIIFPSIASALLLLGLTTLVIPEIGAIHEDVKLKRKSYSIESLKEIIRKLNEEILQLNEKKKDLVQQKEAAAAKQRSLNAEQERYGQDLRKVESERSNTIESLVPTSTLNEAFNEPSFEGIIKRIKARKKETEVQEQA